MNLQPYARRIAQTFGGLPLIVMLAAFVVLATALALHERVESETLDDLSAVPQPIIDSLPIAANALAKDRSVLRIACVEGNHLILVLRTKLAVGKEFYTAGMEGSAAIYVGDRANRIETRMRLVKRAAYDTLVSTRLSATAIAALGSFFGNEAPPKVSVMTLETGTFLTGQAGRGRIGAFAAECRA